MKDPLTLPILTYCFLGIYALVNMHKITITFEIIKINNSISMGKSKERVGGREETNQRDLPVQTKKHTRFSRCEQLGPMINICFQGSEKL